MKMILLSFLQNLNILPCEDYERSDYYKDAEYCHLGCKHCYHLSTDYADDDWHGNAIVRTYCHKSHPTVRVLVQLPSEVHHHYKEDGALAFSNIKHEEPLHLSFRTDELEKVKYTMQKCKTTTYKTCENVDLDGPPTPD